LLGPYWNKKLCREQIEAKDKVGRHLEKFIREENLKNEIISFWKLNLVFE